MAEIDLSSISALPVEERMRLAQAIWDTIPDSNATQPRSEDHAPRRSSEAWRIPALSLQAWRSFFGSDQLTYLHPADDQLRSDARGFLQTYGLPQVVRFDGENRSEISFAPLTKPIVGYNSLIGWGIFFDSELDARLSEQLVIGQEDHVGGVASICVERTTGIVSRLDITTAPPQTLVNSSVLQFGQALQVAIEWSQERDQSRSAGADYVSQLEQRLQAIDPAAFAAAEHYWPKLIATIDDRHGEWKAAGERD